MASSNKTNMQNMKKILSTLLTLIAILTALPLITACSNEDDIDEIFIGRTWYMNGATVNGKKLNSEIKNFYTPAGSKAYYITFSSGTFTGMMSEGKPFSGTWEADAGKQTLTLKLTKTADLDTPFDKQIYNIVANTTRYTSGADFLQLKQDNDNIVLFGASRDKVIN